jgi:hypothetical protein
MQQELITTIKQQAQLLSFNIPEVDLLFPGFKQGDFALIASAESAFLTSLLSVRTQLQIQLGGLNSDVVFLDGSGTFKSPKITSIAKIQHLNPKQALERVHVSFASNAYEVTSLTLDHLQKAVEKYSAKLVIISDIAKLFLDDTLPNEEAKKVFSQIAAYLQSFAKKNKIIVIATYTPRPNTSRNIEMHNVCRERANINITIRQTMFDREFELQKHPSYLLGSAALPPENITLNDFL